MKANGGAIVCPEKNAYYTFTADFSTMTYKWTKLANQNPTEFEYVGLIGVGGKWSDGDDIDLKQVAPHNWYLAKQEDSLLWFADEHGDFQKQIQRLP